MARSSVPPLKLGRYDVIRRLGAGGMAEVYLARSRGAEGVQKLVVVKRILPAHNQSPRMKQMFVDEARLSMRLNHPNIVQVFDFQETAEGFLLAMEFVEGLDLGRLMHAAKQKGQRLPAWVGAYIVMEAARGLHCAHERKGEDHSPLDIVHRDVSPQNILLSYDGGVKVADFGIASAKILTEEAGVLKGKFAYMSPEQARGETVDRRTDIFALGICLHEILTGRALYSGLHGDELLAVVRKGELEAPSLWASEVPAELDAICVRALSKEKETRFATARDMAGAIARALQKQEDLVDAAAVEATISQFASREITSPGIEDGQPPPPPSVGLSAALEGAEPRPAADSEPLLVAAHAAPLSEAPRSLDRPMDGANPSSADDANDAHPLTAVAVPAASRKASSARGTLPPEAKALPQGRVQKELRHVALVHLCIQGFDELAMDLGAGALANARESVRKVLDGIAFKRGARWTWDEDERVARAVVGLTANPSGAPFEAAALALDAHDALADLSTDLPVVLAASVGIVRGVAAGDRDEAGHLLRHSVQGAAASLADALAAAAPPGRTWVAGGLYRLVRREFQWGDAPTIELHDQKSEGEQPLPKTVRAYALERALTRDERHAELAIAAGELVGRDVERADLQAAYHRAVAGPEVVSRLIVGEMGIGKTALVASFLRDLPPDARALRLECPPSHAEVPYAAMGDLVRDGCGLDGSESLQQAIDAIGSVLGNLAEGPAAQGALDRLAEVATGRQAEGGGEEDASFRRKMLVSGVRRLLAALALRGPLVIVVEGVQWGDKQSLELMSDLLRGSYPIPALVILVARSDERIAPILSGIVRVELRGLTKDEQLRLLEMRLNARGDGVAQICQELSARVGGNPFFLLEIVDALIERGAIEVRDGPDESAPSELVRTDKAGEIPLPSTLEQLLAERLHELPLDEKEVAQWIAVMGGPLEVGVLRDIAAASRDEGSLLDEAALEESIVRLCARGICDRKGETIDLRHPVARDVAYMTIESAAKTRMHRRLGERLRTTPVGRGLSAAVVARHLARGDAYVASAEMYLEAAHAARASYQTQLATRYYHRALSLLPSADAKRFVAHEALESSYRMIGRRRERKRHLEEMRLLAKTLKTPKTITIALLRTARLDLDEAHLARGLPVAQRAVAMAEATKLPNLVVEAHALVIEFLRELGDVEGALRAANDAIRISSQVTVSQRLRADVLRAKGILLRRLGRTHEAVGVYAESIALLRAVGAKRSEARTKNALAYAMFVLARYEDAIALAMSSVALDLSIGGRFQIAKTLTNIGQCYARLGDMPRALAYLKRARDAHERYGDQDGRTDTLLVSAEILVWSGDLDGAATFLGDAHALNAVTGNAYDATHELVSRSLWLRARGDLRGAADLAAQARPVAQARGLASYHLFATAIEAEARAELGEHAQSSLLAQTAIGMVENTEGSEFALEVRTMSAKALERASDLLAPEAYARAKAYARRVLQNIRDPRLRALFLRRPEVERLLGPNEKSPPESRTPDITASLDRGRGPSGEGPEISRSASDREGVAS